VSNGDICSQVQRWSYWDPSDGFGLTTRFDARIDGLPETAGTCDVLADNSEFLFALTAVCRQTAVFLEKCKQGALAVSDGK
jgi:hypothetical protein